jgi:hypothetical protein
MQKETEATDPDRERRARRREELRKRWLEKQAAAQQGEKKGEREARGLDGLVEAALTPLYVAVGGGMILFRKLTGKESVTIEDFQ